MVDQKSDWLRITPPACWASPISEGIIEDRAPRNPDPVGRDGWGAVETPCAVWHPMLRMPSMVDRFYPRPKWPATAVIAGDMITPVRAAPIPYLNDRGRQTRRGHSSLPVQRSSVRTNRTS